MISLSEAKSALISMGYDKHELREMSKEEIIAEYEETTDLSVDDDSKEEA